jgi:hypothetical protein
MDYRTRVKRAFIVATVIHAVLLMTPSGWRRGGNAFGLNSERQPIVLALRPEEPPLQFIDTATPAEEPVDLDTDLIAEQAANASDLTDSEGERKAPHFEEVSDFDEAPIPAVPPLPAVAADPSPPDQADIPATTPVESDQATDLLAVDDALRHEARRNAGTEERVQVAKAEKHATLETQAEPREARGRIDGGVKGKGFIGFEAKQHEFAPYLKEVRTRVERRWKAMIAMQYPGSSPTKAVVDCSISPLGRLASVEVAEPGDPASFGTLCKEAIETAGPFPPFPFSVPNVYRNENLEIRWTFSFLQR